MPCIKIVGNKNCPYCPGLSIKYGKAGTRQRFRCKICKRIFLNIYLNKACCPGINKNIIAHVKEGCGIRSISRLLSISATTTISRIKNIAAAIRKPVIVKNQIYEVDELKTYVRNKHCDYWVIYALDRQSRQVVDFKVGKRTKKNINRVIETLLLSECASIYTDRLDIYRQLIPAKLHSVRKYGTNKIERMNLSLRTHLKRLNRKTICFSRSLLMLDACLRIYFWC